MNKLGRHWLAVTGDEVARSPADLFFAGAISGDFMRRAAELRFVRGWFGEEFDRWHGSPGAAGLRLAARCLEIERANPGLAEGYVGLVGTMDNGSDDRELEAFAAFQLAWIGAMHAQGLKTVVCCNYTGNTLDRRRWEILAEVARATDYLGLQAYASARDGAQPLLTSCQEVHDFLDGRHAPLVLEECGYDDGGAGRGRLAAGVGDQGMIDLLRPAVDLLAALDYVAWAFLFCYLDDGSGHWTSFDEHGRGVERWRASYSEQGTVDSAQFSGRGTAENSGGEGAVHCALSTIHSECLLLYQHPPDPLADNGLADLYSPGMRAFLGRTLMTCTFSGDDALTYRRCIVVGGPAGVSPAEAERLAAGGVEAARVGGVTGAHTSLMFAEMARRGLRWPDEEILHLPAPVDQASPPVQDGGVGSAGILPVGAGQEPTGEHTAATTPAPVRRLIRVPVSGSDGRPGTAVFQYLEFTHLGALEDWALANDPGPRSLYLHALEPDVWVSAGQTGDSLKGHAGWTWSTPENQPPWADL